MPVFISIEHDQPMIEIVTLGEASRTLNISIDVIRQQVARGYLYARKFRNCYVTTSEALDVWHEGYKQGRNDLRKRVNKHRRGSGFDLGEELSLNPEPYSNYSFEISKTEDREIEREQEQHV